MKEPALYKTLFCSTCLLDRTPNCKRNVKYIAPATAHCPDYIERTDTMKEHNRRRYFFNSTTRDLIAKMYRYNASRVPAEELLIEEMGEVQQAHIKKKRASSDPVINTYQADINYMEELCDVIGLAYSILANQYGLSDEEIAFRIYSKYKKAHDRLVGGYETNSSLNDIIFEGGYPMYIPTEGLGGDAPEPPKK